ncbi:MAG: AAA family ATPase [Synergistaceae bacterium]|jgi:AAA+ ATPase superfamily predicted ATPase|nr:AAA family ATPase [Synergistaceae bacterium]
MNIIGRQREIHLLDRCEHSGKPEFVAVYGRRRVGKTFLISEHFHNHFTFSVSGVANMGNSVQLNTFYAALRNHFHGDITAPDDWFSAFGILEDMLERDPARERKVLFIDEMPWLDTPKSGFLSALEHFWNSFASKRPDIMLIVCGSAASWMIRNLIDNYGGLHDRVTERIVLEPFTLGESEDFFRSRNIVFTRRQIAEAYMILGGIPYYLDSMDRMFGLNQNIDILLFEKNAKLGGEFDRLYHSLFRHAENHIRLVAALSGNNSGLTRQELSKKSGMSDGGGLSKALKELESCGLISQSRDIARRRNGDYFRLVDYYTLFYFKYLHNRRGWDPRFWTNYLTDPAHRNGCGYAFERVCAAHLPQIMRKLGISGVITDTYAFRSSGGKPGAQIDLMIDRKDDTINLCEIKYRNAPYELTQGDIDDLERRKEVFIRETGTKKSIHQTMIAACGLVPNAYRNEIQAEITLDDLFL